MESSSDPRRSVGARVSVLGEHLVRSPIDAFAARRAVRVHALALGFERIPCEELAIVASELCTNVVKYGVRGALVIERLEQPVRGLAIVLGARDEGPPFRDFEKAIRDRSDDRGTIPPDAISARSGIGSGLGAVQRLTDRVWTESTSGGKYVFALRYVRSPGDPERERRFAR